MQCVHLEGSASLALMHGWLVRPAVKADRVGMQPVMQHEHPNVHDHAGPRIC